MTKNTAPQTIERRAGKKQDDKPKVWRAKLDVHQWFERNVARNLSQIAARLYRAILDGSVDWGFAGTAASVAQLAEHCALSERSIRTAKRELQDAGLLGVVPSGDHDIYYPALPADREWETESFRGVKPWYSRLPRPIPTALKLPPGVGPKSMRAANGAAQSGKRCRPPIVEDSEEVDSKRVAIAKEQLHTARSRNALSPSPPGEAEAVRAEHDGQPGWELRNVALRSRRRRREHLDRQREFRARVDALGDFAHGQVVLYICGADRSRPDVAIAYAAELEVLEGRTLGEDREEGLDLNEEVPACLKRARREVARMTADRWGFDANAWRLLRSEFALAELIDDNLQDTEGDEAGRYDDCTD